MVGAVFGGGAWRSLPVFVSSTFRDLDGERDVFQRLVFPELNDRLRARRCEVAGIDLRWGVDTSEEADQPAKEAAVLTVCLREIERSRPLFVVLLGDRYGWVPPAERLAAAGVDDATVEPGSWSVTHLEIARGLFDDRAQASMAVALVRDPLPYEEMTATDAARFSDAHARDDRAPDRAERLRRLKAELEQRLGERYVRYPAGWDGTRVTGLEGEFARRAVDALWPVLDRATRDRVDQRPLSWQEEERRAVDVHVAIRGRTVVGRADVIAGLVEFATAGTQASGARGRVVVGPPGQGKSAVLSRVVMELAGAPGGARRPLILAHAAGTTPRSGSVRAVLARWTAELGDDLGMPAPDEAAPLEALRAELGGRLAAVAADRPVVLVVDALDQLGPGAAARRLTWLPDDLPADVRVVATSSPGPDADYVAGQVGWERLDLRPLDDAGAQQLVEAVAAEQGRQVPNALLDAVVAPGDGAGEDHTRTPLWLRLVTAELLELRTQQYETLAVLEGTAEQRLESLLVATAGALPHDVPSLYRALYERAASEHGATLVPAILGMLAIARRGLRESDLAAVLEAWPGTGWDPLAFARLRRQLRAHLVEEEDGRWDFTHGQGRAAALPLPASEAATHERLARHLSALDPGDPLRAGELAHHRLAAGDLDGVASMLTGELTDDAQAALVADLAAEVSTRARRDGIDAMASWVRALYERPAIDREGRPRAIARWLVGVDPLLDDPAVEGGRARALDVLSAVLLAPGAVAIEPESFSLAVHLLARRGDIAERVGSVEGAREAYQQALAVAERALEGVVVEFEEWTCPWCGASLVAAGRPDSEVVARSAEHLQRHGRADAASWIADWARFGFYPDVHRDLATVHDRLGDLCLRQDDLGGARDHHRRAVEARRALHALYEGAYHFGAELDVGIEADDPERVEAAWTLSGSLRSLAAAELAAGRPTAARVAVEEALAATAPIVADAPDDATAVEELAAIHQEVARLATDRGDLDAAARSLAESVRLRTSLHLAAPDRPAPAVVLVGALAAQAACARDRGRVEDLDASLDEALALVRTVLVAASRAPDTVNEVVNVLCLAAERARARGDHAGAVDLLGEAERRISVLDPESPAGRRLGALVRFQQGDHLYHAGHFVEARQAYREVAGRTGVLSQALPDDDGRVLDVAISALRAVAASWALGDLPAVRDDLGRAETVLDDLLTRRPDDERALLARAEAWTTSGRVASAEGDHESAQVRFADAVALLDALRERRPGDPVVVEQWAAAVGAQAEQHWLEDRHDDAMAALRRVHAVRLDRHERAPTDPRLAHNLAMSHLRLAYVVAERADGDADADADREVLEHEGRARVLQRALVEAAPDDPWPWSSLAAVEYAAAESALGRGDRDEAGARFEALLVAAERSRALGSPDPRVEEVQLIAHRQLAALALERDDRAAVALHAGRASEMLRARRAAGAVEAHAAASDLVVFLSFLARATPPGDRPAQRVEIEVLLAELTAGGAPLTTDMQAIAAEVAEGAGPWGASG